MAKTNVLDPGHGGYDNGAQRNSIVEDEHALEICLKVHRHLKRHSEMVSLMTRTDDVYVGLSERAIYANNKNADSFVSVHCNAASNEAALGIETYTYSTGVNELKLANCVHGQLVEDGLYSVNRGIKQENFAVVRETKMAAILVELGFLSNETDANLLKKYKDEYAKSIAKGILKYNGIAWIEEKPYGTREVYVDGKIIASSNKVEDILKAVEKGLSTTARIELPKI